jgi:hypothetical protein
MITILIPSLWSPTYNNIDSNFGDILTPYILSRYNIKTIYNKNNPVFIGVGSLYYKIFPIHIMDIYGLLVFYFLLND